MGAAGAAGACATEVSGKPNAAAVKREMRSLFMGSNVLKINVNILSHHGLWQSLRAEFVTEFVRTFLRSFQRGFK